MKRTLYYITVKGEEHKPTRCAHTWQGAKFAAGYPEKGWRERIVKSSQAA